MSAQPSLATQWRSNVQGAISAERVARNLVQIIEAHSEYRRLWMKSARNARGYVDSLSTFIQRARDCNRLVIAARRRLRELTELAA